MRIRNLLSVILFVLIVFPSYSDQVVVNRRKDATLGQPRRLPSNPFVIKEGNSNLFVKEYLKRNPLTSSFSGTLEILNATPSIDSITFDFVGETLTPSQIADVISVAEGFRDKDAFTALEQLNIDSQTELQDAFDQIGDTFDEDNIDELIIPDILGLRHGFDTLYEDNSWDSFSLGEKRILIADWGIGSMSERVEVFPGTGKRNSIYKLFASRIMNVASLEFTLDLIENLKVYDNGKLTESLQRLLSPSKFPLQKFNSRATSASANAESSEIELPVFENHRIEATFLDTVSITRGLFTRDATVDVSYICTVQSPSNSNFRITGCRDRSGAIVDIDFNMKAESRGRSTLTDYRRFKFLSGDQIFLKLSKQGSGGTGSINSQGNRCSITIEEVE